MTQPIVDLVSVPPCKKGRTITFSKITKRPLLTCSSLPPHWRGGRFQVTTILTDTLSADRVEGDAVEKERLPFSSFFIKKS